MVQAIPIRTVLVKWALEKWQVFLLLVGKRKIAMAEVRILGGALSGFVCGREPWLQRFYLIQREGLGGG